MNIIKNSIELNSLLQDWRNRNISIGFVPTMGALHKGHLSLVNYAAQLCDNVIMSIFVNPTQFNDKKDFQKYPRIVDKDIELLKTTNCQAVWLPQVSDIYPNGLNDLKKFDLDHLDNVLEGKFRPGHFQGVCQVVEQLLLRVKPNKIFLGQKDYQQCMVISKMIELEKLNVEIEICPTIREASGLAMSSRNMRLSNEQLNIAPIIYNTMCYIKDNFKNENFKTLKTKSIKMIEEKGLNVDYVEIADAKSLQLLNEWDGNQSLVVLVAAFLGEVRLIDNMVIN